MIKAQKKKVKGKRTRLNPQVRRQLILDEAMLLIGRRGYYGFRIQELARHCRLTDAGLLYYFGSKEGLLIALLEDRDRRSAMAVEAVIGPPLADWQIARLTLDDIRRTFHAIVIENVRRPEIVRLFTVLQVEALDPSHPAHDYFVARQTRVIDNYARMLAHLVPQPISTARQLSGLMRGLEQQWLECGRGFDLAAEWDRAAALLLPSRST